MASSFALCVPILTLLAYPVSDRFPLPKDFVPPNLTAMEGMGVPVVTWKSGKDETKIADLSVSGTDGIDTTMMSSLKHLIETCRDKTKQNLRVRSGYRSYNIQKILRQ